ncbi:MAG: L,D-transpeptidase family protein [Bacteroidota bacterium]|nr:L,D-transpeptidase family protein [Bacteroidota bacterium]
MLRKVNLVNVSLVVIILCCIVGCKGKHTVKEKEIVKTPKEMNMEVADNIKSVLQFAEENNGKINDSIGLSLYGIVNSFYDQNHFESIWSNKEMWLPRADSMFNFIKNSKYYGLYPQDYHFKELDILRKKIASDSIARMDAISWTKADLMLTDAFMKTLKDLKEGRLVPDSVSIISKNNYIDSFFIKNLNDIKNTNEIAALLASVEPSNNDYQSLRHALKGFVDNMDTSVYPILNYPYTDTLYFIKTLNKRLSQSGISFDSGIVPNNATLIKEIKKYQEKNHLTVDGKAGPEMVNSINFTDNEKFKTIAINLDRYKLLPPLPSSYLWVNLPGFYLKLVNNDSVIITSKVIVGKPSTPTPLLTSEISNMVTYPTWTIPASIIKKDILPELKKDPGYLEQKGFSLVDYKGDIINPFSIKWSKYSNDIPWKVVQGSGAENALGIFKFNFNNPYSVYLHDTNQRYLFSNSNRALSHGCVRVQKWEDIAFFIARRDSMDMKSHNNIAYTVDSIKTWIAQKSRKRIMVKNRLPLFIEYYTCSTKNNKIIFYDDIYDEDKDFAQTYFSNK